jgi:hypothetical protein
MLLYELIWISVPSLFLWSVIAIAGHKKGVYPWQAKLKPRCEYVISATAGDCLLGAEQVWAEIDRLIAEQKSRCS